MAQNFYKKTDETWVIGSYKAITPGYYVMWQDSHGIYYIHLFGSKDYLVSGLATDFCDENGNAYTAETFLTAIASFFVKASVVGDFTTYTDSVSGLKIRTGVRSDQYVIDKELIVGGFSGAEGVGWENISGAV